MNTYDTQQTTLSLSSQEVDLLANRLNYDAVVFKGCTMNELLLVAGIAISMSCLILGMLVQLLWSNFIYGIAAGFAIGGGLTYVVCSLLEQFRRGQDKGFIQQLIAFKLYQFGFARRGQVIRRSGIWTTGRFI